MLSSVTGSGCMNFLTGSDTSPTTACCGALKSLTGIGMECLCLIVTASVPINLPINRTLAISLPRACGIPNVPVQCKASAAPLPAPGPVSFGPTTSPTNSQIPDDPAFFGPTTSQYPDEEQYNPETDNRRDPRGSTHSASLPSSSLSLELSFLLFAFAFEMIDFF
ncbi:Non-specific lipid transfer protein GPI-anchored 21 [Cardamine amara subsp. amara]|uniref:Non-specific lipid transfer protein GPI-anchored 21 n=1 Tax=Cardamine amara subsp. amara TaxID=228776 RepID=A0ABD1B5V9_CARAN